ncbi:MAG: hypothetical protein ACOCPN_04815 [Desulfonatronovibrionaceae bacterium]
MKYQIITFGCQMNSADSLWLDTALTCRGHQQTQAAEEADFFIVNTCSVREKPEQKVYSLLGRLRDYHDQDSRVFVCVGAAWPSRPAEPFWKDFPLSAWFSALMLWPGYLRSLKTWNRILI